MIFGVPKVSVLGPLLISINDLHMAIKYSLVHHFEKLLKNELKQLQKHLNINFKYLCNWLKGNKISLNPSKTELILFQHPNRAIN